MDADSDLERCVTIEDIRSSSGSRAIVLGTYVPVDVRMRKTGAPEYTGHAAVRLQDGTEVLLEPTWSDAARRSEQERERFEHEQVKVTGTVHMEPPEPPNPVAHLVSPCVAPVEAIELT